MQFIKSYDFYHELRSLSFIEAIWLFGSRGRDQQTQQSDIDLAILAPQATAAEWQKVEEIIKNADTLIKIDFVRLDELDKSTAIYHNILKDRKVLFERKPNNYSWYHSFLELGEALDQLEEMVNEPETAKSYVRDATIHRFEFSVELFWKTLKKICLSEQYEVTSPRNVLQQAYEMHLVENNSLWHKMLDDRNETSHFYKRKIALEIYSRIPAYYKLMQDAYNKIKSTYAL